MSNTKKYLVFDVGDVLLAFHPRKYLLTKYSYILVEQLIDEVFHQPEFMEYERGIYTNDDLIKTYINRFPKHEKEIEDIILHWDKLTTYMDNSWNLVKRLKSEGYTIYLLSTMGKEWKEMVYETYPDFKLFDGALFSYEVAANKPNPLIYQELFRKFHLEANHGIFIDDRQKNVEEAIRQGMKGILFTNYQDIENKLMKELSD